MLAKAAGIGVDEVVIDLEDAVRPERRSIARELAIRALGELEWRAPSLSVRVNAHCEEDVTALAGASRPPSTIVLPKVESHDDVASAGRLLAGGTIGIQALIETPVGVLRALEIAAASDRVVALIVGYADLAAVIGGRRTPDQWRTVQDTVLLAARAAGIDAIDGPFLSIRDADGLRAAATTAAQLGFDGKWAIHPDQVPLIVEAFTPSEGEVARAREVVSALERSDRGAVAADGEMLDEAVRVAAKRLLARAEAAS